MYSVNFHCRFCSSARIRERRVLVQMCILVVAFVACWLPFFVLLTAVPICQPDCITPHIETIGMAFQVAVQG